MRSQKFVSNWERTRQKGSVIYILKCVILILIASEIGKGVGDYIVSKSFFNPLNIQDYVGAIFICFISISIGLFLWRYNEKRYKQLAENMYSNKEYD